MFSKEIEIVIAFYCIMQATVGLVEVMVRTVLVVVVVVVLVMMLVVLVVVVLAAGVGWQ